MVSSFMLSIQNAISSSIDTGISTAHSISILMRSGNMPYIKKSERQILDNLVIHFLRHGRIHGRLNYFIFKLTKEAIKLNGESYGAYKEILGELECAKFEIYRRMVAKYEDTKIEENGDVE
jgi:hypothetical protein